MALRSRIPWPGSILMDGAVSGSILACLVLKIPTWLGGCSIAPALKAAFVRLSRGAGLRWAHCYASCEIAQCGGARLSEDLAMRKEFFDLKICLVVPRAGFFGVIKDKHCRSFYQPFDFEDNKRGRDCPQNKSCEDQCQRLFGQSDPEGGVATGYPWNVQEATGENPDRSWCGICFGDLRPRTM